MKKLTTIQMIQEIMKDRSKKFKSKSAINEDVVASFRLDPAINGIFLNFKDTKFGYPLEVVWGYNEKGVMTWIWEEVDQTDWSKVEVDTKVLVSHNGEHWIKRYFSKFEAGFICVFADGNTSWSAELDGKTCIETWEYTKLAE